MTVTSMRCLKSDNVRSTCFTAFAYLLLHYADKLVRFHIDIVAVQLRIVDDGVVSAKRIKAKAAWWGICTGIESAGKYVCL